MKRLLCLLVALLASPCFAEANPVVVVNFSNPGLVPAHWTLEIHPDGSAHFRSVRGSAPRMKEETIEPPDQDKEIHVSAAFADHVFQVARRKRLFQFKCESSQKVAFQGTKRFAYSGPEGEGACEFNYSKDQDIQALSDEVTSLATTIVEGARLQALLLHDRLGLDRETQVLAESAADGRAIQMGSIRDILERLAEDDSVLERVRRRARALLARAQD